MFCLFLFLLSFSLLLGSQLSLFLMSKGLTQVVLPHTHNFHFTVSNLFFENRLEFIELETLFFKQFQSTVGKRVWLPPDTPCRQGVCGLIMVLILTIISFLLLWVCGCVSDILACWDSASL